MSRHRIVRTMNYEDEYYDDEDEYSRSVEDNYCISPSTAAQFTWNREKNVDFAAYMGEEEVINEEEEDIEVDCAIPRNDSLNDSSYIASLKLSELDQARLMSCLEEARNILGDSLPESVMSSVIIQNGYNLETSINQLLSQLDAPKPQREPRQRKNRSQDEIDTVNLDNLLAEIEGADQFITNIGRINSNLPRGESPKATSNGMVKGGSNNMSKILDTKPLQNSNKMPEPPPHWGSTSIKFVSQVPSGNQTKLKESLGMSLSDLVKKNHIVSPSKSLSTVTSTTTRTDKSKEAENRTPPGLSLAELAHRHKSSGSTLGTTRLVSSDLFSSKGVIEGKSSLSDLVAQHSAQRSSMGKSPLLGSLLTKVVTQGSVASSKNIEHTDGIDPNVTKLVQNLTLEKSQSPNVVTQNGLSLSSCLKTNRAKKMRDEKHSFGMINPNSSLIEGTLPGQIPDDVASYLSESSVFQKVDAALVSKKLSCLGFVVCNFQQKRKLATGSQCVRKKSKYPKFICKVQVSCKSLYKENIYHHITPFDFSTPSPDDIVKSKQKQAFTRSDKEFVV